MWYRLFYNSTLCLTIILGYKGILCNECEYEYGKTDKLICRECDSSYYYLAIVFGISISSFTAVFTIYISKEMINGFYRG